MTVSDMNENCVGFKDGILVFQTEDKEMSYRNPPSDWFDLNRRTKVLMLDCAKKEQLKKYFSYELVLGGLVPILNTQFIVIRKTEND